MVNMNRQPPPGYQVAGGSAVGRNRGQGGGQSGITNPTVNAPAQGGGSGSDPLGDFATQKGTEYASSFIDDTAVPWMKDAGSQLLGTAPVAGIEAGAITSGVATGAEAAIAADLGVGVASAAPAAATAATTGAAAGAAGGMGALAAAAPWVAGGLALYSLFK